MIEKAVLQMERALSRRAFLTGAFKPVATALLLERFGNRLFATSNPEEDPYHIFGALGNIVIPVDQDPGWATFEPEISEYALNVFTKEVLLGGDDFAFQGYLGVLTTLNNAPPLLNYGPPFVSMVEPLQARYLSDIISAQFENDGFQEVLGIAVKVAIFAAKAVFFSNFPQHLAQPGQEFQIPPEDGVKTGWEIMNYKGAVGPEEEEALRQRYLNSEELPGVDPNNPYV